MFIVNIVINVIILVLGITIGFYLNRRLSDRTFLVNEIYSPLYEEVKIMGENISEFKSCFFRRRGGPDYSAPLPPDKIPGNVRSSLIQTGKYFKVPKNLKIKLDEYYNMCQEWNSELETVNLSRDWREGKIKDIKVINEGRGLVIEKVNGGKVELFSVVVGTGERSEARDYKKYEGLKEIDWGKAESDLKKKEQDLRNLNEKLLTELEGKIHEPSPLFGLGRRNRRK